MSEMCWSRGLQCKPFHIAGMYAFDPSEIASLNIDYAVFSNTCICSACIGLKDKHG